MYNIMRHESDNDTCDVWHKCFIIITIPCEEQQWCLMTLVTITDIGVIWIIMRIEMNESEESPQNTVHEFPWPFRNSDIKKQSSTAWKCCKGEDMRRRIEDWVVLGVSLNCDILVQAHYFTKPNPNLDKYSDSIISYWLHFFLIQK